MAEQKILQDHDHCGNKVKNAALEGCSIPVTSMEVMPSELKKEGVVIFDKKTRRLCIFHDGDWVYTEDEAAIAAVEDVNKMLGNLSTRLDDMTNELIEVPEEYIRLREYTEETKEEGAGGFRTTAVISAEDVRQALKPELSHENILLNSGLVPTSAAPIYFDTSLAKLHAGDKYGVVLFPPTTNYKYVGSDVTTGTSKVSFINAAGDAIATGKLILYTGGSLQSILEVDSPYEGTIRMVVELSGYADFASAWNCVCVNGERPLEWFPNIRDCLTRKTADNLYKDKSEFLVVDALPETANNTTLYILRVPTSDEGRYNYNFYIMVDGRWVLVGSTMPDTAYATPGMLSAAIEDLLGKVLWPLEYQTLKDKVAAGKQYYNTASGKTISEYIGFSASQPEAVIVSTTPITFEGEKVRVQQNIGQLSTTGVYNYTIRYAQIAAEDYVLLVNCIFYE